MQLAQRTGRKQDQTQKMVSTVIEGMMARFEEGNAVSLPNFGTFEVKKRMERVIVNPSTKQRMLVPPKLVLNFRPVTSIKEILKKGGENNG